MKAKYYLSVAECLNIAFGAAGTKNKAMDGAIKVMTLHPEWCAKRTLWDELLWDIIQDVLNSGEQIEDDEYFIGACAILEANS